jgi:peptidyl-prolyl cis-trans isomerase D
MFEFIRTHQRLMQFMLLMIILPAFVIGFGLQGFSVGDDPNAVAKVCGTAIPQQEFVRAQQEQLMQMRQQFGAAFRAEMLDTPESRAGILDRLVNQRVLACSAVRRNIVVTDDRLRQEIMNTPGLQVQGKFNLDMYKAVAAQRGITTGQLDDLIRQDLVMQVTNTGVVSSAFVPQAVQNLVARAQEEQREVQDLVIKSDAYVSQVKVTPEAVKAYYDGNQKDFQVPPQVRAEYVVLSAETLGANIPVNADEIKALYDQNKNKYGVAEQRQASHILFKVEKPADKDAARAKAEEVLKLAQAPGADFAALAKKYSADSSAAQGGDLGSFARGAMVKPFEDAVFGMKDGQVSGIVESEFGFHIIKLTAIKAESFKPFEEVRPELEKEWKAQRAQKLFAESSDGFADQVYTQPDSLKPAADKYKLRVQTSEWFSRAGPPKELANAKLLERLFGDDGVKNKRNTEAVELAPGTLVSARVVEYKPQSILSFDDAKPKITAMLTQKAALALVKKDGEAKLKAAQANADSVTFGAAKTITRGKPEGVEPLALKQVMGASAAKLPVVVGTELPDGYAIYRINKVIQPEKPDPQAREAIKTGLARAQAESDFVAYLAALKVSAKVELRMENLEKKQPN